MFFIQEEKMKKWWPSRKVLPLFLQQNYTKKERYYINCTAHRISQFGEKNFVYFLNVMNQKTKSRRKILLFQTRPFVTGHLEFALMQNFCRKNKKFWMMNRILFCCLSSGSRHKRKWWLYLPCVWTWRWRYVYLLSVWFFFLIQDSISIQYSKTRL